MEKHLNRELEILAKTNHLFKRDEEVSFQWYTLCNNEIFEHQSLLFAMAIEPEYLILKMIGQSKKQIVLYFNKDLVIVPCIEICNWKLYDNFSRNNHYYKFFNLADPSGVKRPVDLTAYFPYLILSLKKYIECGSFSEFDIKEKESQLTP